MRSIGATPAALLLLGVCGGLAGCTGSLFQSKAPPAPMYLLSAKLGTAAQAVPADLAVLRPRVRAGLETDRIAVLYPDRRLDYFADARWSGPLDEVLQDLALQAFGTGAHLRNVSADVSAFTSAYWLEIDVVDFQAEYTSQSAAPTIHVHLLARVGAAGDRRILGTVDATAREIATDNRVPAIVDAYERAAGAALAEIVTGTSRTLLGLEHR
ncbi:MAG TPA: ABC-type transport auxiliary lipoprotein family protein [Steroidobacteraceae bacterium]